MMQIFPPTAQPPFGKLLWPDAAPDYIRAAHARECRARAVNLVETSEVSIGGLGLLLKDGELLFPEGVFPAYVEPITKKLRSGSEPNSRVWLGALLDGNWSVKEIDSPVIAPFHPNWVFGHVLLEMLPKLVLLDLLVPPDVPVAVASSGFQWMLPLVRRIAPRRDIVTYDHHTEVLRPKSVLTCTNLISQTSFHPAMREVFQIARARTLLVRSSASSGENTVSDVRANRSGLVYISRSGTSPSAWRRLDKASEKRIERKLALMGFEIVHPQRLPFSDQMRLFGSARLIVGEFSSALHNAVFSAPGTAVVCLNCINDYQSRIAMTFGHAVGYIEPTGGFRDFDARLSGNPEMEIKAGPLMTKLADLMLDMGLASGTEPWLPERSRQEHRPPDDTAGATLKVGGLRWGGKLLGGIQRLRQPRR